MLGAFEELWASGQPFSPHLDLSSAPQPPLVTPVDVPAPVLPSVPVAVSVASTAASSTRSGSFVSLGRFLFPAVREVAASSLT